MRWFKGIDNFAELYATVSTRRDRFTCFFVFLDEVDDLRWDINRFRLNSGNRSLPPNQSKADAIKYFVHVNANKTHPFFFWHLSAWRSQFPGRKPDEVLSLTHD
jgi:hypothetical protein